MTHPPHIQHRQHDPDEPVYSITDATESRSAEMHSRMVKYTISMSVRLACFIAAFFTSGPLQWVFLAGAIFLPWFAVVVANGGADRSKQVRSTSLLDAAPLTAIGQSPSDRTADREPTAEGGFAEGRTSTPAADPEGNPPDGESDTLEGELVEEDPRPSGEGQAQ